MQAINKVDMSPLIIGTMRLGTWGANLNTKELQAFIEGCLELDLTTFDHADIYGDYTTEAAFGKVFKENPGLRKRTQLITKYGIRKVTKHRPEHRIKSYDASAKHMLETVDNSLKELNTDFVDVLLIHRPDYLMDVDEIAEATQKLYKSGKIHAFGVSNFTTAQVDLLTTEVPIFANQIEASLLHLDPFEDGTLEQCQKLKIKPMAWSPFGGGAFFSVKAHERVTRIKNVAAPLLEKYEASIDQIFYAFLRRHPSGILPVLGTSKLERIKIAKGCLAIELDAVDWYDLYQASTGETIP